MNWKLDIRSAEYGFRVIVARNKLFEKAFQHLGVLHVKQLNEDVEKHFGKDRVGPRTKKEERLLALLNRVETHFDLEPGTIDVANLEMRMVYTLGGEGSRDGDEEGVRPVRPQGEEGVY